MKYRLCEKCKIYAYSTGKDYDDYVGEFPLSLAMRGINPKTVEMKGLCPFCNKKI